MPRQVVNPLGMSTDPMRTIYYAISGAWWDEREAHTLEGHDVGRFAVRQDLSDIDVDEMVTARLRSYDDA